MNIAIEAVYKFHDLSEAPLIISGNFNYILKKCNVLNFVMIIIIFKINFICEN
jgi:hypothetical protein